ncbi:hypothetical protein CCACVL1_24626 [Corchorus capsularis]|uniref:Retrovirus-related Pol polyprotein from transposon TNT 1-94-like beta-barrel domain-containing protein n=1 Tax=Corchorus capsularis TaxID=210143 RepID=A0A1R3GNS6_COCAP|nr:hypothetical protein CCACVL1_24626 [Corchorus capsularis]
MTSNTSSNSSETHSVLNTNTQAISQTNGLPPLITIKAVAQLPIKLAPHNFPSWRAQFNSLIIGHKLLGYINGSKSCPASQIPSKDDPQPLVPNLEYDHWIQQDQLLLHDIIASATETIILFFASCTTAQVNEDELVIHILNGIGSEFKEIAAGIRARESYISFEELLYKMTDYESYLSRQNSADVFVHIANVAQKFHQSDRSRQGPKHSYFHKNFTSTDNYVQKRKSSHRLFCQFCDRPGHTAKSCYQIHPKQNSSSPSAHVTTATTKPNNTWLLETGASHHVTSYFRNLDLSDKYQGTDELIIGDGSGLNITHTGSLSIPTKAVSFNLKSVLCVPKVNRNLCSVSKFYRTNNVSVEFYPFSYLVKDLQTRKAHAGGLSEDGIYQL